MVRRDFVKNESPSRSYAFCILADRQKQQHYIIRNILYIMQGNLSKGINKKWLEDRDIVLQTKKITRF